MQIKILIVDDDMRVLHSLGTIFTTYLKGYLVLTATSANEGLCMIKEQKPDIIIVDVRLGPESGMDLVADYQPVINKPKDGYRPVFIVITAYDDEEPKKLAEKYRVDAYLTKPFSREKILYTVIDGISKVLHNELVVLDTMKNRYKKVIDRAKEADRKLNGEDKPKKT